MRIAVLLLTFLAGFSASAQDLQPGRERIPGAETLMGMVQSPAGYQLRVFVTRPQNATGKLPVIFMVGWLSCDSVEQPKGPEDGFIQLLYDLAGKSGFATYRVDKPGVGDSGGPKCGELDFKTELAAYRTAFSAMKRVPFLDASRIYVLGFSNGGGFAPLVAEGTPIRGYLVLSGWYKTWLEHMLELERRRMKLEGVSEPDINARMKKYATFYERYLNGRQTPAEVIRANPALREIWYDEPAHQYGRPAAFYHQLQELNLAEVWAEVNAPVLAVHGEYDWIMSRDDYKLLTDSMNLRRQGSADFVDWPRLDHVLFAHGDERRAFGSDPDRKYDPKLSEYALEWLRKH